MTREAELQALGVSFDANSGAAVSSSAGLFGFDQKVFSGYGAYTPVSIGSETVKRDAVMERDKSRRAS